MAQRWPAPNVKPKLSQEQFDDAVKTNIEDFDMGPEEAVKSAIDEFKLQGYDMSCVVQTVAGGAELSKHPVSVATGLVGGAAGDTALLAAAFAQLKQAVADAQAAGQEAVQQVAAVAVKAETLGYVLRAISGLADKDVADALPAIQAGLEAARSLMAPSQDARDAFDGLGGPPLMLALLQAHRSDLALQADVARCSECASYRQERVKEQLMEVGYVVGLLELLGEGGESAPLPLVGAACGVLRSVCTADDDRPPCSKAFANARLLAKQHQALRVLLSVLRGLQGPGSATTVSAVLATIRTLAANEEICRDFSDDGGVATILSLIRSFAASDKDVVRCGLGALRQLTHADGTKRLLASRKAAPLLMQVSAVYPDDADVVEPALGVVANMTLRQPEVVTQCEAEGVIDWVIGVMRDNPASSIVQRQAAILTRNMVVRNTELRPVFLEKGAEGLLRAAKKAHPKNCTDVGSAALRDLGLDNYNA